MLIGTTMEPIDVSIIYNNYWHIVPKYLDHSKSSAEIASANTPSPQIMGSVNNIICLLLPIKPLKLKTGKPMN